MRKILDQGELDSIMYLNKWIIIQIARPTTYYFIRYDYVKNLQSGKVKKNDKKYYKEAK